MDLLVENPEGKEFSYKAQDDAGKSILCEYDPSDPGIEEFGFTENPPPCKYKMYYNQFSKNDNNENSPVKGLIIYKDGVVQLPLKTLS